MPEEFPSSPSIRSFSCRCEPDGWGSVWLELSGELDLAGCPQLLRALSEGLAFASTLVVDLRKLTFIDCAALADLFDAAAEARRAGGGLTLVGGSGQVRRLLDLTGVPTDVERLEYAFPRPADRQAPARAARSARRRGPLRSGADRDAPLASGGS